MRRNTSLDGITIIDLSRVVAGPFATQILGDLGATVIKVERPDGVGDDARGYVPSNTQGVIPVFTVFNRRKQSIALDMRSPEGRQVLERLIGRADVLIHNFRPGVMRRLGLEYEDVKRLNPRLVYCGISGFGESGPLREKAANDVVMQAFSGLLGMIGHPDDDPVRVPVPVIDLTTALYTVIGILAALAERDRTGEGNCVEVSLLESALSLVSQTITSVLLTGDEPKKMGSSSYGFGLPNQAFATSDGWVVVSVLNAAMWARFCACLDAQHLADDDRFRSLQDRHLHRPELSAAAGEVIGRFTTEECIRRMESVGVSCAPIHSIKAVSEHEQVRAVGAIDTVAVGEHAVPVVGTPIRMLRSVDDAPSVPFVPGEDTVEILGDLGYDDMQIAQLRATGAIV